MRTFIAIDLPESLKRSLTDLIESLMTYRADVRWVKGDNLHVTIKFLGNIEKDMLTSIEEALKDVSARFTPFDISFEGIGCFPNMRRPRIIWIGIRENPVLTHIHSELEERLCGIGFEREKRRFSPHLTAGRVMSARGFKLLSQNLQGISGEKHGIMEATSLSLMRSDLSGSGARYTLIRDFPLGDD